MKAGGIVAITIVVCACLISVVILVALHDDPTALIGFLTVAIIPTVTSLFAYHQASQANEHAQKAETNTNGAMHSLIAAIKPSTPSDHPTPTDASDLSDPNEESAA